MKHLLTLFMGLLITSLSFGQKVTKEVLGVQDGHEVCLFTLTNKAGNLIKLTNFGARIVRIDVPDKNGVLDNVTTGAETFDRIVRGDAFGGASIGRFANRIANGTFSLDGNKYSLPINNRPNTLHGGPNGWYSKVWEAAVGKEKKATVVFTYLSPDMEEGFPGNLAMKVAYTWTNKNEIIIDYAATSDKKTVINVTNHAYFNLNGVGKGSIFDQLLTLKASNYTPLDATKIPTGQIVSVKGTPFDFTSPHPMGYQIGVSFGNEPFSGYDHNYVLDKKQKVAAQVYDPKSGRVLEVLTDEPGMQLYTGSGAQWKRLADAGTPSATSRGGFALETQHYPDSPNQPTFPTTELKPGQKFKSRTIYRFSIQK